MGPAYHNELSRLQWDKYLDPRYDLSTNFRNIFKCMYIEKEMKEREKKENLDPFRLVYGLPIEEISQLLKKNGIKHSPDELSIGLDTLVDYGIAVPIFIKEDDVWTRLYRFAESVFSLDQYEYLIAYCMKRLCDKYSENRAFPSRVPGIPRMLFEKSFVLITDVFERFLKVTPLDIKIKKQFDRYGARLEVEVKGRRYTFADWCEGNSIVKEETKKHYILGEFFEINPKDHSPVPQDMLTDIDYLVDLILHVYEKVEDWKNDYRTLLALTTCNNFMNYLEALKAEFALWSDHPRFNFNLAINALSDLAANLTSPELINKASNRLGYVDGYFAMSKMKQDVWENLSTHKWKLDYICSGTVFEHPYKKFIQDLINESPISMLELPLKRILCLNKIARCLTSVCRTFLWENHIVENNVPSNLTPLSELIPQCNSLIEEAHRTTFLQFKQGLSYLIYGSEPLVDRLKTLVKEARHLYSELQSNYRAFLETTELKLEEVKEPRTVFSYDWIHSTEIKDKELREKLAWKAYQILERFTKLVGDGDIDPTFDDFNLVMFREIGNAIECALNFVAEMKKLGIYVRSSLISNTRLGSPWGILKQERLSRKYSGPIFEIAARARNYFKKKDLEHRGESYIFFSDDIKEFFDKALSADISKGIVDLKNVDIDLPGFPPTNLYVYKHAC